MFLIDQNIYCMYHHILTLWRAHPSGHWMYSRRLEGKKRQRTERKGKTDDPFAYRATLLLHSRTMSNVTQPLVRNPVWSATLFHATASILIWIIVEHSTWHMQVTAMEYCILERICQNYPNISESHYPHYILRTICTVSNVPSMLRPSC